MDLLLGSVAGSAGEGGAVPKGGGDIGKARRTMIAVVAAMVAVAGGIHPTAWKRTSANFALTAL
jgi:hypothetical protein